jgi:uncharacterized protein YbcI
MSGITERPQVEQSVQTQISDLVVQHMHACTGRGPTKARTSIDRDLVTVVLCDLLNTGERRLLSDGRDQLVLDMRQAFQQSMGDDLINGVERVTGRTVIAFMSANHLDPDIAIESFVLEPLGETTDGDTPALTPDEDQMSR